MYLKPEGQDFRPAFIETLIELAEHNPKVLLFTCDVGFSYLEKFSSQFPMQYFNFGITEPATSVIAAALARKGFKPFFYSMIPFVSWRIHEQIRNAICMHQAPVTLAGVSGSTHYRFLGFSHSPLWENEEVEWMEKLPGMRIYLPKTPEETKQMTKEAYQYAGPSYIRL